MSVVSAHGVRIRYPQLQCRSTQQLALQLPNSNCLWLICTVELLCAWLWLVQTCSRLTSHDALKFDGISQHASKSRLVFEKRNWTLIKVNLFQEPKHCVHIKWNKSMNLCCKERGLYLHNSEVHRTSLQLKISIEHLRNVTYDLLNAISQTLPDYPLHSNDVWQSKLPAVKNITLCEYEWACERSCVPAARRLMTALFLVQTVAACHHSLLRSESKTCPFEFYIWSILSDCLSQKTQSF